MHEIINQLLTTNDSKVNFLKGLIAVIKADGIIHQLEKDFFSEFSVNIGLSERELKTINDLFISNDIDINLSFDNQDQKMFFLKEALQLCYIDGKYHNKEKALIKKIGENLGISEVKIKEIEKWTFEGLNWYKNGLKIFNLSEDFFS